MLIHNGWNRWGLVTAALWLAVVSPAEGEGNGALVGNLEVDVTQARAVDCEPAEWGQEADGGGFALCFSAAASAAPELVIATRDSATLDNNSLQSVVVVTGSLDPGGSTSTSRSFFGSEKPEVFRHRLKIPAAPLAESGPSPDAPLVRGRVGSLFDQPEHPGFLRPGRYRVEVTAEVGDGTETFVVGVEVFAVDDAKEAHQWVVADGAARILVAGCQKRELDPVVELSLKACEDPRHQVKAVTAKRQGGLTLTDYVDNSLAAYQKIWRLESRSEHEGEATFIKLELVQTIAGKQDFVLKYFVDLGERVMVVTFYGPVDEKRKLRRRFGTLEDWLMLTET